MSDRCAGCNWKGNEAVCQKCRQAAIPVNPNFKAKVGRTVRREVGRMNKTEAAYSAQLDIRLRDRFILWWGFERVKLRLADNTHLTMDFMVIDNDQTIQFHDVKGFMEDDAAVKLKTAAEIFPFFKFFVVKKTKEGWDVKQV